MTTRNKANIGWAIMALLLLVCIGLVALASVMTAMVLAGVIIFFGLYILALFLIYGDN